MHRTFWSGNLKGRDSLEYPGVDGRIIMDLKKIACEGVD
jgi:hypothetical protein